MATGLKLPFYAKASLTFMGLFAFITTLSIAQTIIVPIIYSVIIAIVLSPLVNYFVRKKVNRILAISIVLSLVIFSTLLILFLLSAELLQFGDSLPKLIDKFHEFLDNAVVWVSDHSNISVRKINLWLADKHKEIVNKSGSIIGQTIIGTGSTLIVLILIPVYVFMILYYQPLLIEFIHKLFKSSNQDEVNQVVTATKKIIQSYLVGLLLEAAIIATLNSASLLILGIDYAILFGVIGALLNVIPYIGGVIAVTLPMMIAVTTKSPIYALLVLGCYTLIQIIDNHFIIPNIVASKVKLNALISVIVVLVGGALWGIPGMFLSIPLTAILKVIFDHIEALKPWGFLFGNTMPTSPKFYGVDQKTTELLK